jgi:ComF family protein
MSYMASLVAAEVERRLSPEPDTVLVPIPRSPMAILENGFDQSVMVGEAVAGRLSISFSPAIKHRGKKKQKLLGYQDRLRNAKEAFLLDEKYADSIRGKRVILYDDIITTGASAAACVALLLKNGAVGVDFVSFARTEN